MALRKNLILRKPRSGCLEGRTPPIQLDPKTPTRPKPGTKPTRRRTQPASLIRRRPFFGARGVNASSRRVLGEVAEIFMGQSPPGSTYNNRGNGLPFFQGKAQFGEVFPVPDKWCSEPLRIAHKGDILVSVRAPVGPTNLAVEKCCIGRGLAAIRSATP
jgi:hypothetical protein